MMKLFRLRRDESGAGAVEFALAAPVLITMIYGIFEIGQLYEANASMQHALGEGARFATLCVPTGTGCNAEPDDAITARMNQKLFGPVGGNFTVQPITAGTNSKTLTITYTRATNFLFFAGPTITLTRSKLVYTPSAT